MKTSSSPSSSPLLAEYSASPSPPKDEKGKTIPFLRQLTEMLQNNEELITFVPGQRLPNNETVQGKIIVHDRNRVQSDVLPVYFNHASFASLRRQLSYFSFVRVGKSRQSGVTYTNEQVVELSDIRKLKRRTVGQAGAAAKSAQKQKGLKKDKQQQKQSSSQPQSQGQQKHPEKKPQQETQQLATTSADVASAVLSGTLHAAKTNEYVVDINTNSNSGGGTSSSAVMTSSNTSQSSISQSIPSTSSSSSTSQEVSSGDNISNSKGSNKHNGSPAKKKTTSDKKHKRKSSSTWASIPKLPRKDRARFDRLLSINNIVPFIHLPAGHSYNKGLSSANNNNGTSASSRSTARSSSRRARATTTSSARPAATAFQKENKPKMMSTSCSAGMGRDRATSDGAINALLALGTSDRQ